MKTRRWIEPQDFIDMRGRADLKRYQVAALLDVTTRTIQNLETGGARIPWMAYKLFRILAGYALPGSMARLAAATNPIKTQRSYTMIEQDARTTDPIHPSTCSAGLKHN